MAGNRKASRGTNRRSGRGKAVGKSAAVQGRVESKAGSTAKPRNEKPKKESKQSGPVAKATVAPVESTGAASPAEISAESGAVGAAVEKPAAASTSVTPVDRRDAPADKSPKAVPRGGGEMPATTGAPATGQPQERKAKNGLTAKTEVTMAALPDQQPGASAEAAGDVVSLASDKNKQPREKRLRDDPRYTRLAGPDIVPLSRSVSQVVWTFDVVDTFTGASTIGNTRVFAVPRDKEAKKKQDIELATFSTRSARLVVQTTTTLTNDVPTTRLVPMAGGTLDQNDVVGLQFANDLYAPKSLTQEEFEKLQKSNRVELSPAPSYPFPSVHDSNGSMAFILGLAPASFNAGSSAQMISPALPDVGGKSLIDAQRRFALWGPAGQVLASDKPSFEVQIEISDAPGGNRTLTLTYRATREKSGDNSGAMDGANNTDRMKLTGLSLTPVGEPPIQAKNVPPVHLLLN